MAPAPCAISRAAVAAALLGTLPAAAWAYPDGRITGRSATGCGAASSCHGVNAGASAALTGPMSVAPGSRQTFTLTLRSTLAGFAAGGLDVAARGPSGTALAVNPSQSGTRLNGAELVMSAPVPASGGAVIVRFDLVAPASGSVTLQAAGNAVNVSGTSQGDAWALATLQVAVAANAPDASAPADAAVRDASPPADVAARDASPAADVPGPPDADDEDFEAYDPSASYGYGRCAAAPWSAKGGAGAALAVVLLAAVARRRRGALRVALGGALSLALVDCSDEPPRVLQRDDVDLTSSPRCVRGVYWAHGDRGDNHMHPGRDCIGCHTRSGRGPRFTVAGTLFNAPHEEDDCFGYDSNTGANAAAEVEVTDATGRPFYVIANRAGNFYTTHPFRLPLQRVRVFSPRGAVVEMGSPPPHGDCNVCHSRAGTVTPTGDSPGRIVVPR